MNQNQTYPNIDMQKTGIKLKRMLESSGYTPRKIQEYLHLSCVQPIYRWYKGIILPSVDHLFMLSELLGVHMEELLVKKNRIHVFCNIEPFSIQNAQKRYIEYYERIMKAVV